MKKTLFFGLIILLTTGMISCDAQPDKKEKKAPTAQLVKDYHMAEYAKVKLTSDISHLSTNQKEMVKLLFEAASIMDGIFWQENVGNKEAFLGKIKNPKTREYASINYGPWDELNNLTPFITGWGEKPKGAEFYPHDMTVKEFESFDNPDKTSLYTLVKRDSKGNLTTVWYHDAFKKEVKKASDLLKKASALAENEGFKKYLELRAEALLTDDYYESDMAWLDMSGNLVDLVIGPIENYTDQLFGYKAAHESFVLIKDVEWSDRLSKYAQFLPQMQKDLPVDQKYKQETPGLKADLNAYDVVYYAGDCNMGGKTIAINLPNDERVQLKKGTRKLQLKNAMRAKFDEILVPISKVLIARDQRQYITFNAFFANTMFHEVAHGMGIKNTITGKGPVRKVLKEKYSAIEEGKADILGLFIINKLYEMGEFQTELKENYVTFMAGIFRSVRFGASSAHGMANMLRFNFFLKRGAFTRNEDGTYSVNFEEMKKASKELTQKILKIQGDGDYEAAKKWIETDGIIPAQLQEDLDKVNSMGIPVDIYFEQGPQMLGL